MPLRYPDAQSWNEFMLGHAERIESGCSPGYTVAVVRGKGNERLIVRVNL